jgi:hypothetical protein
MGLICGHRLLMLLSLARIGRVIIQIPKRLLLVVTVVLVPVPIQTTETMRQRQWWRRVVPKTLLMAQWEAVLRAATTATCCPTIMMMLMAKQAVLSEAALTPVSLPVVHRQGLMLLNLAQRPASP